MSDTFDLVRSIDVALVNKTLGLSRVTAEGNTALELVRPLEIESKQAHTTALEHLALARKRQKEITAAAEPYRAACDAAKKAVLTVRDAALAPWAAIDKLLAPKAGEYDRRERARADAEETRRLAAALAQAEEDRLLEAAALEQAGAPELAAAVAVQPLRVAVPAVEPEVAKIAGTASTGRWKCRVLDWPRYVTWMAANRPDLMNTVAPVQKFLDDMARMQQASMNVPGLEAYQDFGYRVGKPKDSDE